jgi:23S rRNA pseudouridine2605 synthase
MTDSPGSPPAGERLAKVIARAGLCSRRDAEAWIREGRVAVNGNIIRTPAFNVTEKDRVTVDGEPLQLRSGTRLWLYHKPPGLVVTEKDPEGRPTIFEALKEQGLPRVLTIGRLDINTEGLLLLTNDGGLKRVLELPSTGWLRRYRVRAFGTVTQPQLDRLKAGLEIEGIKYGPIEATLERQQASNVWLLVALREGKNREVKNVLGTLGLTVNRLIRVSYGPFQLGELAVGAVEAVRARVLRDQLGKKLAAEAGVDFESEMPETVRPRPDRPGRPDLARPSRARAPEPRREGRPRRIHFDDGRPPEEFTPPPERRGREDRTARSGQRGAGPERKGRMDRDHARPARGGDAPQRSARPPGERSRGPVAARGQPARLMGGRPSRPTGDRSARPAGGRPARPGGDRPARPTGGRPSRPGGSRPRPGGGGPRPGSPRPPRKPRP